MPKSVFTEAYATFVATIAEARREAGLTQVELSERLGRPQPFISKVEQGIRRVDVIEFYAIARALGLEPTALFKRIADKLPKSVEI